MYDPIISIESIFFSILLSIILLCYGIIIYPIVKNSFKIESKNKWNSLLALILIIFIAIMISLPLSDTTFYLFMPMNWYAVVVAGALGLVFYLVGYFSEKTSSEELHNRKLKEGMDEKLEKSILDTHNFTSKQELKRKIIHMSSGLFITAWILEPLIFFGVQFLYQGIINTPSAENFLNAKLLFEDQNLLLILNNGLIAHFFMLICLFMGNANMEIVRLRFKKYNYILKRTLQKTRRPTEVNDLSASILLLLGLATSSIILTYTGQDRILGIYAQMGVICITVFSDMFAALIGRKWGKHKWPIVKGKSYEGSIAGFLVGFFTAFLFVGPLLAFVGSMIFVITDIGLDKIKISDNASNPIILSIVFKILIQLVSPVVIKLPILKVW
ncbi:MAG: putative phosphatidate cytidylyltransferase [Promethearchaeota archaeon]|nr:MAG: putative phosphatidate cytidylyltransferase [Candidatus Lokiarchaeota archaeon]